MGRWEKWWQISQSSGFQNPISEGSATNILRLNLEAWQLFPTSSIPRASKFKWKRYAKEYGDAEDEMNVTVLIPIYKKALRRALKLPLGSCLAAMKEEIKKDLDVQMPYLNFSLIDTAAKWSLALFCSRSLSSVMPVSDFTVTRICYAAQGWDLPYLEKIFPIPFFRDLKVMKKTFEGGERAYGESVLDLSDRVCSCLDFKLISIFFKVSPEGKILDVKYKILKEAPPKQSL